MIFKRLIIKNFRQFEGEDHILDFNPVGDKHVTLIFASNGVGKTTILSAIDWCLYGGKEIIYGDKDHRGIFLNKNVFEQMTENEEKVVEVILTFEDRNHDYVIKRSMIVKKVNGKQENRLNEPEVTIDRETQWDGQKRIENVLSKAMREYFFFKGEGVRKYADGSDPKLVQKGIKNIMKIDFREEAKSLIEKVRKKFEKEVAELQQKQGAQDIPEARKKVVEDEIESYQVEISKLTDDIATFSDMLADNQLKLSEIEATKKLYQQVEQYQLQIQKIDLESKEIIDEQKSLVANGAYLALAQDMISTTHEILENKRHNGELPIIGIGKEFLEKLIADHKCICGEEFIDGDTHYLELQKMIERATAKTGIEASVSSLGVFAAANLEKRAQFEHTFKKLNNNLKNKRDEKNKFEQLLQAVEDKIESELPDEENLIRRKNEILEDKRKAETQKIKRETQLEGLEQELKEINNKIATTSVHDKEIVRLRNRVAYCQQAIDMLQTENEREIDNIRRELTKRLQDRYSRILHADKTAELDEDFKLNILEKGQSTSKSDGENKLISLIFISTLIDMAREKENKKNDGDIDPGAGIYPIVIDSPYAELDSVYKKSISETVKTLAPQVIILMNQAYWNEDNTISRIFEGSVAHQYALVAHRTKLNVIDNDRNILKLPNHENIELEVQDTKEYVTIQKIEE